MAIKLKVITHWYDDHSEVQEAFYKCRKCKDDQPNGITFAHAFVATQVDCIECLWAVAREGKDAEDRLMQLQNFGKLV